MSAEPAESQPVVDVGRLARMDVWSVPVSSARTLARPVTPADVDALVELACDEQVRAYLGGPRPTALAREKAAGRIAAARPGDLIVVDRTAEAVIGHIDLQEGLERWEISYEFVPAVWGRGLAQEAIAAVLQRLTESLVELVVVAETQVANDRSRRLLSRLGFAEADRYQRKGADQVLYIYRASPDSDLPDSD